MKYKIKDNFVAYQLLRLAELVLDGEEGWVGMDRDDILSDLAMDDRGDQKHMLNQVRKILREGKL